MNFLNTTAVFPKLSNHSLRRSFEHLICLFKLNLLLAD